MSATTVSGWSEEKPKHVRDVASALRARVREEGCNSLEECERFRDLAEFTKLSWEILYTKNRRPARSFHHNERFRNMVRRAYHELEAEDDVAHTATSPHGAKGRCDPESKCVCVVCYQSLDEHARFALEATNKLPRVTHFARGELAASPSSRARSRWQSVKQYQLRTSDSTNLPLSPATSSGNLRAAAS